MPVSVTTIDRVAIVRMMRPERRNAVDAATAKSLADAFRAFDTDTNLDVAVIGGADCVLGAGAGPRAPARGHRPRVTGGGNSPGGPPGRRLPNPALAATEGPGVAGGLELMGGCDRGLAGASAMLGVFNRRFG